MIPYVRESSRQLFGAIETQLGLGIGHPVRMAPRTRLQFLRPFTTTVFNRFSRLFAGWLPGFGILRYRGRKTDKEYRTPMNVFRRGDECIFALTYGSDVQWVKNIVASGETWLRTVGRDIHLVEPELFTDPQRRLMPIPVRQFLGLMRVSEFMRMRIDQPQPQATRQAQ
jgi:deazaflavin-dependent oxidoreductase (nitroreductase family)